MEFHNKTGSEFGGGTLHLKVLKMLTFGSGFCLGFIEVFGFY
jgi:hypothetical protein